MYPEYTEIGVLTVLVYISEFWRDDSGYSCAEGAEAQILVCFGSQNIRWLHKAFFNLY